MEESKIYREVYTYTIKKEIFESNVAEFNGKVYWILTPKKGFKEDVEDPFNEYYEKIEEVLEKYSTTLKVLLSTNKPTE